MAGINDSSNSSSDSFSSGDDLLVVSFWSTILIYALITNTLTVIGILRSRSMRGASSYWIVISLAVCDLFMVVISLIHIIPATYMHEEFVEIQHVRTIWAMFVYNVFWYTGVVQLAAMAVNRFVSIVFPLRYKRVFAPRNTLLIIFSLYLLGLLSSLPSLHDCCYIVYDHHIYVTYYWPEDSNYMWLDILLNTLSVLTMILCYAAILVRVRKSSMTRRKHQMVALAARARRSSGVALLASSTLAGHSTTDSASTAAPTSSAAKTQGAHLVVPNGNICKTDQGRAILKHHLSALTLPASSSLSVLNNNRTSTGTLNHNNNDTTPTKQSALRTTSASPVMARPRCYAITASERESERGVGVSAKLLAPQAQPQILSRLRRQALLTRTKRRHQLHQQPQQASRREIRLFVQFFVVSLVFLSTWVTWQWLPRIPNASKWIYVATTTFFFINNAVNPTVYLIFNSGLRHQVKTLFCPNHVRKCESTKAAAAAAAAMGDHQALTRCNNSSSSELDENNQHCKRNQEQGRRLNAQEDFSASEYVSEGMCGSSNLALATAGEDPASRTDSEDCSEQMQMRL